MGGGEGEGALGTLFELNQAAGVRGAAVQSSDLILVCREREAWRLPRTLGDSLGHMHAEEDAGSV